MKKSGLWGRILPLVVWTAGILLASSDLFASRHSGGALEGMFAALGISLSPSTFARIHLLVRKGAHVAVYAVEGALAFRATRGNVIASLLIAGGVAIVDESLQSIVPTRTGSGWDVVLDLAGAAIAITLIVTKGRK